LDNIIDSTDSAYINEKIKMIKNKEINKTKKSNSKNKEYLIKYVMQLPEYKKSKGLTIGNMSSQILAIIYLNELDHFIKENLKIKYYIRYKENIKETSIISLKNFS